MHREGLHRRAQKEVAASRWRAVWQGIDGIGVRSASRNCACVQGRRVGRRLSVASRLRGGLAVGRTVLPRARSARGDRGAPSSWGALADEICVCEHLWRPRSGASLIIVRFQRKHGLRGAGSAVGNPREGEYVHESSRARGSAVQRGHAYACDRSCTRGCPCEEAALRSLDRDSHRGHRGVPCGRLRLGKHPAHLSRGPEILRRRGR